jgi:outer membrane protein TolC
MEQSIMTWNKIAFSLFMLVTVDAGAAEIDSCEPLTTYDEVLSCALARHPEMGASGMEVTQAKKNIDFAGQRPNPELSSQGIFGGSASGNYLVAEFNFAHTFELGGKRAARIQAADADLHRAQGKLLEASESVYLRTALALHRVRQIRDEWDAIEDALQTFARMGKQYRGRPRLNPEQRSSLRIFEIAEQDYKLRQAALESERELRLREIELAIGKPLILTSPAFPARRENWPKLPVTDGTASNSRAVLAEAELAKARADFGQAKAQAWPDVKAGPTLYEQKQFGQSFQAIGVNLALPLPLYNRNEAGKEAAAVGVDRAERLKLLADRENELEKSFLRHRYEAAVASLKNAATAKELLKKHEETEALFSQGFVNGTVVIEIHRQISDFLQTLNQQELAAEEALIRFNALTGGKPKEN